MFSLFFVLQLALLVASTNLPLGQTSSGRYDILQGTQGQSACTLSDDIVGNCPTSSSKRDNSFPSSILDRSSNDTSPVPSKCTCNTIFFNIWSACTYSTGNSTLPNFTQWTLRCQASSVNVDSSTKFSELQGNLGIDVPLWATLAVPGNTSFDLQRAVALVSSPPNRWTTIQIILPIVVAVITSSILGVALLIHKRRVLQGRGGSRMEWPRGLRRLRLHTSHRVITRIDRQDTWEIDGPGLKPPSFVKAPFEEENMSNGQLIRALSVFDPEPTDVHELDKKTILSLNPKTEKPPTGTNSFRFPTRPPVRLPWKRRPPHIRFVPATSRFRVDDVSKTGSSEGMDDGFSQVNEVDEAQELADIYVSPEEEETTNLISPSEREDRDSQDVLLISQGGRDFTLESRESRESRSTVSVNSQIKVISPSVSSNSPRSTVISAKPTLYVPIPPPPPSHAAPAPPIMPRNVRTMERSGGLAAYFNHPPFLSPIREDSPAQSYSSSNVSIGRSPAPSNSERASSLYTSPASLSLAHSHPLYFDLRSQSSNPSLALESEDDIYMDVTVNAHGHGPPPTDDALNTPQSFYPASPAYEPRQFHPVRNNTRLPVATDPASFFPGAVRAAGYHPRTYTQQDQF